jgi:predicted nucleotidyltransferase
MAVAGTLETSGGSKIDATSIVQVVKALHRHRIDFVIIGNCAAQMLGAPVTTGDIDIYVRRTPANLRKLVLFLRDLGKDGVTPSAMARSRVCEFETAHAKIDVVFSPVGMRRFESVRSRRIEIPLPGAKAWVASLDDVIASKSAAGRAKDRPVLPILRALLEYRNRSGHDSRRG